MPTDFKLPELGENVTAGDVVRILVGPGDSITKDQAVLELETDKATIEVPSSVAGTIKELKIKQGDRIKVGQVVLTVDDGGEAKAAKEPKGSGAAEPAEAKPADADKPAAGDKAAAPARPAPAAKGGGTQGAKAKPQPAGAPEEGGLSQKAPGQKETGGDGDTGGAERADADRGEGVADQPQAQQADGGAAPRRGEVVDISRGARPAAAPAPSAAAAAPAEDEGPAPAAAPSVRRMARELGVEIRSVSGSGPGGRINPEDIQAFVRTTLTSGGGAGAAAALPDFTKWGEVERKPMSNIRRKTAEHLARAWNTIPHVTQHDKADITELEALRKQYSPQAEQAGGKMTMTAIALKVVGGALRRFPQFNASADIARNEIVYKQSIHVGVAVDTDRGLLVPVIRDVDRKGIFELSAELAKVSEKARGGKLSLDEMSGGGFTISNLGGIGGTAFTPIVNWPEVAILGISRGSYEPVYQGSEFVPRMMLPLSLSYDHRVVDGADAARFLRWVAEAMAQPFVLAL